MVDFAQTARINQGFNLGKTLEGFGSAVGERRRREATAKKAKLREIDIEDLTDELSRADLTPERDEELQIRLARLNPKLAQEVGAIRTRADTRQKIQAGQTAEHGFDTAVSLERFFKDPVKLREQITQEATLALANGRSKEEVQALLDIGNRGSHDERVNDIMRLKLVSRDFATALASDLNKEKAAADLLDTGEKRFLGTGETKVFNNGTILSANKDLTRTVTRPDGVVVKGKQAEAVLKKARKDELDFARTLAGEKKAGGAAIDISTKAVQDLGLLKKQAVNFDRAIDAIDAGAQTGTLISKFPSFRTSSINLAQIAGELGLDIIGQTTFGNLSEGELQFALDVALPTNLAPKELRAWVVRKRDAQAKLSENLEDMAIFLGTPGNTPAQWIQIQREARKRLKDSAGQGLGNGGGAGGPAGSGALFVDQNGKLQRR